MVSNILRKKAKRVNIPRRITRFKFYSIVPFIGSNTLQSLKMDLSFGKVHDKCRNRSLCQFLYVDMRVDLFKIYFKQGNKIYLYLGEKSAKEQLIYLY